MLMVCHMEVSKKSGAPNTDAKQSGSYCTDTHKKNPQFMEAAILGKGQRMEPLHTMRFPLRPLLQVGKALARDSGKADPCLRNLCALTPIHSALWGGSWQKPAPREGSTLIGGSHHDATGPFVRMNVQIPNEESILIYNI